tara:strand:- start:214 stop:492 length:279 start_codon:yes stop_codon:yes gene_type:complete
MKELLKLIAEAAQGKFNQLRDMEPADFELQVEAALVDEPIHEANEMRRKVARIADVLGNQTQGQAGSAWRNVAWNLSPSTGRTQRVGRSFNR